MVDSSVAVAWVIPDEVSEIARYALAVAYAEEMIAPRIFWYEFRNTLIVNERRGRLLRGETDRALAVMAALDPTLFDDHDEAEVIRLARVHSLSIYDAAYLELAARTRQVFATFDRKLEDAALQEGVAILRS